MSGPNHEQRSSWKKFVTDQQESGLSIAEFCRKSELNVHQFYYYKSILFPSVAKKVKKFIEVKQAITTADQAKDGPSRFVIYLNDVSLALEGKQDLNLIARLCHLLDSKK